MDATAGPCLDGPTLDEAIKLASRAHTGQADKAGDEYIGHPLRVMRTVATSVAAVLHDVVEDSDVTLADLRAAGYPVAVVAAVDALTHPEAEPTEAYLARVAADPIAVVVKRADMADNSDPARLARLPAETADRYALRYAGRRRLLDDLVAARERTGGDSAGGDSAGGGPAGGGSADGGQ
jgi:(p)ppGpp synthase/HD superfamily hydrolase